MPQPASDPASLSALHDIVEVAPVSPWPWAPGWYALVAIAAIFALHAVLRAAWRSYVNRYRKLAIAELESLLHEPTSSQETLRQTATLLKRTALMAWPREVVASLSGDHWLDFLDRSGHTQAFTQGSGRILGSVSACPDDPDAFTENDVRDVATLAKDWIRNHRVDELEVK